MVSDSASLLSGRAQERLIQLHRTLSSEVRSLATQQSLLLGALQACDRATQESIMRDYAIRVDAVLTAISAVRAFLTHHAKASLGAAVDKAATLLKT